MTIEQALEKVGPDPSHYPEREADAVLSGGERKHIELSDVLMNQPRLAILDEPASGIDAGLSGADGHQRIDGCRAVGVGAVDVRLDPGADYLVNDI